MHVGARRVERLIGSRRERNLSRSAVRRGGAQSDGSRIQEWHRDERHREGDEAVQLYVRYLDSKVERPLKQLRNFKRVTLNAGENQTVQFVLRGSDLAYWAEEKGGVFQGTWKVEPGKVEILVGASSEDIKLKDTVEVVE